MQVVRNQIHNSFELKITVYFVCYSDLYLTETQKGVRKCTHRCSNTTRNRSNIAFIWYLLRLISLSLFHAQISRIIEIFNGKFSTISSSPQKERLLSLSTISAHTSRRYHKWICKQDASLAEQFCLSRVSMSFLLSILVTQPNCLFLSYAVPTIFVLTLFSGLFC